MADLPAIHEKLLDAAEDLIRFRFGLAGLAFDLASYGTDEADVIGDAETGLRAHLEHALVDCFDPLLRSLLGAAGGSRARILEGVLDLAGVQHRLRTVADSLPRSPEEDAMLDGEIPPDAPTEVRTTIGAVLEDQLDLAIANLLNAAGYKIP